MMTTKMETKSVKLMQKTIQLDGHASTRVSLDDTATMTKTWFTCFIEPYASHSKFDPLESRRELWRKMFGSKPMPQVNPNAADAYSGSLGKDMNLDPSIIEEAFEQLDRE